jgi:hypothetical protein
MKHCTQDVHVHIGMNGREHIYIINTQYVWQDITSMCSLQK